MAWVVLVVAGMLEIGAVGLTYTKGFTRRWLICIALNLAGTLGLKLAAPSPAP